MKTVWATLITTDVEPGWPLVNDTVHVGKRYRVDLSRLSTQHMTNRRLGRCLHNIACVWVEEPGPAGWFPLFALKLDES